MKNAIAKCLCLTLLTAAAACPAATQPEPSTRRAVIFGQVLKLLSGKRPYLDLTQGSAMQSFHFTIGAATKPEATGSLPASDRISVEAHVVRDHKRRAVILHLGEVYVYYTSDGSHSFLAMADPMDANHFLATRGAGVAVGGFLTKQRYRALGLPGSDMFGFAASGKSSIFLRVLGLIHTRVLMARRIEFRALPRPTLFAKWTDDQNAVSTLRVVFNLGQNHPFPVRRFALTQLKAGLVSTAWISDIGDGAAPGEPVMHRIKKIEDRSGLPWKNVSVTVLSYRLADGMHYFTGTSPTGAKSPLIRRTFLKRFLKWTTTPDTALAATHAVGKSASGIRKPKL